VDGICCHATKPKEHLGNLKSNPDQRHTNHPQTRTGFLERPGPSFQLWFGTKSKHAKRPTPHEVPPARRQGALLAVAFFWRTLKAGVRTMPTLDWSQCPAVESIPGKVSGAWVFKDTRMPVSIVFENLEAGATIDEIVEWFDVKREEIVAVLEFAARSLDPPAAMQHWQPAEMADAHSL
jgi:uncharacterized protein (DUF433 family)